MAYSVVIDTVQSVNRHSLLVPGSQQMFGAPCILLSKQYLQHHWTFAHNTNTISLGMCSRPALTLESRPSVIN